LNEIELIVTKLKQTFSGSAWHGPSFMSVLYGVDKAQARARPIEERHTIWETVDHSSYWMEAVTRTLHGEKMPDIRSTEDWPQMGEIDEDWTEAQEKLKKAYEALVNSIKDLNKSLLTREIHSSFQGKFFTYTYRKMLHGISDHNTYHAGQIALLRKRTA
jgi:uncharacterized damage-inducible protein DinB